MYLTACVSLGKEHYLNLGSSLESFNLHEHRAAWNDLVMPLTELPHSHINRNRSRSIRSDNASHRSESRPTKASAPDPLQTMLKTTTEIGDVGPLVFESSRRHHRFTRESLLRADGSYGPVNEHAHGYRPRRSRYLEHPERRDGALLVSQNRLPSRSASVYGGARSIPSPATSQNLSSYDHDHDHRSYSLTHSSNTSYSLPNRRSHVSPKSFGELHLMRPRSPFVYPTKLKRPGFRPSSPAFSQYNGSDVRAANGLDCGLSHRTSSPSSLYARRRVPAGVSPDCNQSMPSLPIRSPYERAKHCGARTPPLPTRMPKYKHLPDHDCVVTSVLEHNTVTVGDQGSRTLATQPPRYYDYSEAFEEHGVCHGANHSEASVSIIDQTIPEGRLPSMRYKRGGHAALVTEHIEFCTRDGHQPLQDHIPSSGGPHTIQDEEADNRKCVKEPASGFGEDVHQVDTDNIAATSAYQTTSSKDQTVDTRISRRSGFRTIVQQGPSSPTVSRSRDFSFVSTSSNPENLGISSSLISLYQSPSVPESSIGLEKANEIGVMEPISYPIASFDPFHPQGWKIPSLDFSLMDLAGRPEEPREGPKGLVRSRTEAGEAESPPIHAPVPRRSLSTQSKLSKILSLDDGFTELADHINTTEEDAEAYNSINSNTKTGSKTSLPTHKHPSSRLSIRSLSRMMKLATVGERDVHDPDELSASKTSLVSTTPTIKLVKRPRHGTEINTTLGIGNVAAVDEVLPVHTMSRRSSGWRTPAANATTEGPEMFVTQKKGSSPGQADDPVHKANNGSTIEDPLPLPADTSFRSISPPTTIVSTSLPYSFIPLAPDLAQTLNLDAPETGNVDSTSFLQTANAGSATRYRVKIRANRKSDASFSGSQPWNFEESYPWTDRRPPADVRMPTPLTHSQQRHEKPPKFKLKVSRASKFNETTVFRKAEPPKRTGSPSTPFSSCHPTCKHRFNHFIRSRRNSTSSDSLPAPSLAIGTPAFRPTTSNTTNLSLLSPAFPSPDVQSFFSDDSSHVQQKGSIRKRLSEFRAKLPASRGTATDETKVLDRNLSRSAMNRSRASRRSSNPSEDGTSGMANMRSTGLKVVEKVKGWWQQGAGKVRVLGGKGKGRDVQGHVRDTGIYAGV